MGGKEALMIPKAPIRHRSRRSIFHQIRHPGESRDPEVESNVDGNFTDWTPAFAGVTAYVRIWVMIILNGTGFIIK
jgi:hypothetical protein